MAIVYNPYSELLREPNLLVNGKKPVGNVKPDPAHPLTPLIDTCLLFQNSIHDYSKAGNTFTLGGDARVAAGGLQLDGTGDYVVGSNGAPGVITNPTGEIYIFQFATASTARQGMFFTSSTVLGVTVFDRQIGIGNAGGLWARWWNEGSSGMWEEGPTNVTDGKVHTAVIYADKAKDTYSVYLDGRLEDTGSSGQNGYDGYGNNYLHIGVSYDLEGVSDIQYFNGTVFLAVRAAGSLSSSLLSDLSRDPWQFVIPS